MPHPLVTSLAQLRRKVRWLAIGHGVSWVAIVAILALFVLGGSDWLIRFEDRGIRIIGTLIAAGLVGWALYRFLWPALAARLSDLELALRVERRFPQLNDRLASGVQFLSQAEADRRAGSAELRKAVIRDAELELASLDLDEVIEHRPVLRASIVAATLLLIAAIVTLLDPSATATAVARLVNPLGDRRWPQQNHLQFREPVTRLALGQTFEVELIDARGEPLPEQAWIEYRLPSGGSSTVEKTAMQYSGDRFVARRDAVGQPFSYRAVGGDDQSMDWIDLEVVEPPLIESLELQLHYPQYTGWPPESTERHVRALAGTRVAVRGTSTKPVQRATVCMPGEVRVDMRVTDDGYGFSLPADAEPAFVVEQSGAYWIELEDAEGLLGGADVKYDLRAVADLPPTVAIDKPAANIYVTAEASVPLRIVAKDDLALQAIELRYTRSDRSEEGEFTESLYLGPDVATVAVEDDDAGLLDRGESRTVEQPWDLSALALGEGAQLTFLAAASDYRPMWGQSQPRRLTVISHDELQQRLAERQRFILSELSRVLKMQQDSRTQTRSLEIQWKEVGELRTGDVDHIQGAELTQRQVDRALTSDTEGVRMQIDDLLSDLANNKLDSPDLTRRIEALGEQIDELATEHLPAIEAGLTTSMKAAQSQLGQEQSTEVPAQSRDALAEAGAHQDEVVAGLEQMLGELSQWDNYRRFYLDVASLRREQAEVAERVVELGKETLSRELKDVAPQQQAELQQLAQQQLELARRLETLQQQMAATQQQLEDQDPLAAETLGDALHQARQEGISGQMRGAGQNIEQNQIGQANDLLNQSMEALQEMLDVLANRREHELERLVKKLREAEQQLAEIRKQQEGLRKKIEDAAQNPNEAERERQLQRLSRQQRELQQEAERFARRLQRLQADRASQTTAQAGQSMQQAGEQGEQGNADGANQEAARAERDLEEAQQQLAERRRQAEADLAMEQLARIQDELKALRLAQQGLVEETARLTAIEQTQGRLTRGQAASVRDLSLEQSAVQSDTELLSEKLSAAAAFRLALSGAAQHMARAAEYLDRRELGPDVERAEASALRRLEQLITALASDDNEEGAEQGGAPGEEGEAGNQIPGDGIADIAQLKLIKLLQQEINTRTLELEEQYGRNQRLAPEQQAEYEQLSVEQGELADLIRNMLEPEAAQPEDDPAALPDLDAELLDESLLLPEDEI